MTDKTPATVIGIDVGTSGVRAMVTNAVGDVLAEQQSPLSPSLSDAICHEQQADDWWVGVCRTTLETLGRLRGQHGPLTIAGVAVTSTSGSLVLVDQNGVPVRPAIIYDDARAATLASELAESFPGMNASYSLAKALWVRQQEPAQWSRVARLLHPGDWLTGKLTGLFETTDASSALKLGFDLDTGNWSTGITNLHLGKHIFPRVVSPGTPVGTVTKSTSEETGIPFGTAVFAGATDGMASLMASGASDAGDANTTLGTTLVWKALSPIKPKLGPGMYCHRHPNGWWAPGAASNTGPGSFREVLEGFAPKVLDQMAARWLPAHVLCYSLRTRGERFPFLNPGAEGFREGKPQTPEEWHAAQLQSLAFVERWGYERLEECGVKIGDRVYSTGAAAASPVLSQLRADVLKRCVVRCQNAVAGMGAAILAAAHSLYGGEISAAIHGMTRVCETFAPNHAESARFEPIYRSFREACSRRGYV